MEGFSSHYLATYIMLPHAIHCFDNEFHVSRTLSRVTNCVFADSKDKSLVQLSDVWVSLLSRLFQFLDEQALNCCEINAARAAVQLDSLRTIKRLIDRADSTHRSLLSQVALPSVVRARERTLQRLCEDESGIS